MYNVSDKSRKSYQSNTIGLEDKTILEVACGCVEFAIAAAELARKVYCIDLDSQRLLPEAFHIPNLHFETKDATSMT